jgi:hypothetical protein
VDAVPGVTAPLGSSIQSLLHAPLPVSGVRYDHDFLNANNIKPELGPPDTE